MSDVRCPYCKAEIELCHDDGFGVEEDKLYQEDCEICNKRFVYRTYITLNCFTQKADCLNDAEHDYQITHPLVSTRLLCTMCGEEKPNAHPPADQAER